MKKLQRAPGGGRKPLPPEDVKVALYPHVYVIRSWGSYWRPRKMWNPSEIKIVRDEIVLSGADCDGEFDLSLAEAEVLYQKLGELIAQLKREPQKGMAK